MTTLNALNSHTEMPLPQTFNTSSVSVWFEAECVSWLVTVKKTTISSDLVVTL